METAFESIDHCIRDLINYSHPPAGFTEEMFVVFKTQFEASIAALRKEIIAFVFSCSKHQKVEFRIQQYQHQFVQWADEIEVFIAAIRPANKASIAFVSAHNLAATSIEGLLSFLAKNFSRFLNMQERVAPGYKRLLQREMKLVIKPIKTRFENLVTDNELADLFFLPVNELINGKAVKPITYHDAWYIKNMYADLYPMLEKLTKGDWGPKLLEYLVGVNYNAPLFLQYYTRIIEGSTAGLHTRVEQIEKLSWWQKEIAHMYQTASTPYKPCLPGVKESLLLWIKDELAYIDKIASTDSEHPADKEAQPAGASSISTTFSVQELAAFTRLMNEAGLLQAASQQELINFCSRHFKTKTAPAISPNSFKNHYYDIAPKTAKALRNALLEMINKTRDLEKG